MTNTQVQYWQLREGKRHNVVTEKETYRHNIVTEDQGQQSINETKRHNLVWEGETKRHNLTTESESRRHNLTTEQISAFEANTHRAGQEESARHNRVTESQAERNLQANIASIYAGIKLTNAKTEQQKKENAYYLVNKISKLGKAGQVYALARFGIDDITHVTLDDSNILMRIYKAAVKEQKEYKKRQKSGQNRNAPIIG